jgi:hypothetical protein
VESGGDKSFPRSQHPRVRGLQRAAATLRDRKASRLHAATVVEACSLRVRASCLGMAVAPAPQSPKTSTAKGRNRNLRSHSASSFILNNSCMTDSRLRKTDVWRLSARVAASLAARVESSKSVLRSRASAKHETTVLEKPEPPRLFQRLHMRPVMQHRDQQAGRGWAFPACLAQSKPLTLAAQVCIACSTAEGLQEGVVPVAARHRSASTERQNVVVARVHGSVTCSAYRLRGKHRNSQTSGNREGEKF